MPGKRSVVVYIVVVVLVVVVFIVIVIVVVVVVAVIKMDTKTRWLGRDRVQRSAGGRGRPS